MPAHEPVILEERKFSFRHIGPRAQVYAASPAPNLRLLNRPDMVARPLTITNLPISPDFANGQYNLRLMDAGDLQMTFPNKESSDGVPWHLRFDPDKRLQWLEVMIDDYLEGNFVIVKNDNERDHVEVDGFDGWFCLKSAFERDWTVIQSPRDTIERATQLWVPVNADNFLATALSTQWNEIQTNGGQVSVGPAGGCILSVPASPANSNTVTNGAGSGVDVPDPGSATPWANPGRITQNDGSFSTTTNSSPTTAVDTDFLEATNFGFAVPTNATITGVLLTVKRDSSNFALDNIVKLIKGGTVQGTNQSTGALWTGAGTATYGGAGNLWGLSLTPADVNSSNFGAALSVELGSTSSASVDFMSLTVFWTVTATNGAPVDGAGVGASVASFGGTSPWVNPGNISQKDANGAFAVNFSGSASATSYFLKATGFGFAVPSNATIVGIQATVWRKVNGAASDLTVNLLKAGAATGNNKAAGAWAAGSSFQAVGYGGSADLWGAALTPADVNNNNFGLQLSVTLNPSTTAYVDFIELTVHWTIPSSNGAPVLGAGAGANAGGPGGTSPWVNPGNITQQDNIFTTSTNFQTTAATTSHHLYATGFGFTIPVGAVIVGVAAIVRRKADGNVTDQTVRLLESGAAVGTNKASGAGWAGSVQAAAYGGASDLWGVTLSPADINDPGFGLTFLVNLGTSTTAYVDSVQLVIHYTTISGDQPVAGIQTSTVAVNATGSWRTQSQVWVPSTNGVISLSGLDGVGLTITESSGDTYTISFFGAAAVATLIANGNVVSVLTPNVATSYSLELESDGTYVFAYINGSLAGCILRNHPTTTSLSTTVQLASSASGSSAQAIVTGAFCECCQPFLMAGTDKGDYVLPGNQATNTSGGLHARYSNNADLQSDTYRLLKIHTPPRMVSYGNTSSNEYQNQQDTIIDNQQNPLPGAPTSDWSCIWFGSVWLKLTAGNYTFSVTLPAQANNQAVRIWIGKTKLGEQLVDSWNFTNTAGQSFSFTVSAASLTGTLSYGRGTAVYDGWYPIKVEYAVDGTPATAPILRLTSSPAAYTDPGGSNIPSGAQSTILPATSLSPLGCDDNRYQGTSHFDLAQKTAVTFGYQLSLEPYQFETLGLANQAGYFPGVLAPRLREGQDYDSLLEPDLHPRQPTDALADYGNILDAADQACSMWGNGAGFQNGQVGQLQGNVYDPTSLFEALYDIQGWQDASDASFIDLLHQILNSELSLRLGPWQSISAAPHGRPRMSNIWPLQGTQAAMRWRPGDGLRVLARDINVDDANPRQLWLVTRQILPNGVQSTSVGLAAQPNLDPASWGFQQKVVRARDPRVAVIKKVRQVGQWQRSYQRSRQTLTGTHQRDIPIFPNATSPHESAVALLPTDTIMDASLRINWNQFGEPFGVFVNGVDKTALLGGPWTTVPVNLPLLRVAQTEASANQLRVTLHNRSGVLSLYSYQLIVDVLR